MYVMLIGNGGLPRNAGRTSVFNCSETKIYSTDLLQGQV